MERIAELVIRDVVIADGSGGPPAATISDQATYQDPKREPAGVRLVVVNGELVYDCGRHTGARPGRVLAYQP